jgi:hypothetical protein
MIPTPIHLMATRRHKKHSLPADICVAAMGARAIHDSTPDNFCAFSWPSIPGLGALILSLQLSAFSLS